jgi:hypothetical protein
LAYPNVPTGALVNSEYLNAQRQGMSSLPIFVMSPLRGQLEQATRSVVNKLRMDGDETIFWINTSGWLNSDVEFEGREEDHDFFLDEGPRKEWRLTERGNRRVAMLLHLHVCRYLSLDTDKCAILSTDV